MTVSFDLPVRRQLHQEVADILRTKVLPRHQAGQRLPTERQLSERFAVSVVTVREALRSLAQEGLVKRRHGSGTYVTDRRQQQHVGVYAEMDIFHPRISYIWLRLIRQLRLFFQDHGFRVRLYLGYLQPGNEPDEPTCLDFVEDALRGRLCGVATIATPSHPRWMEPLREQGVPVVGGIDDYAYGVGTDPAQEVRAGIRYLLERGRRRIALLGWKSPRQPQGQKDVYLDTFQSVMTEFGASIRQSWIRRDLFPVLPGAGWSAFREVWSARTEKPDGLLVSDDVLFQDVSAAIMESGIRVPEQLLVVTHANRGSGVHYPFPTTRMELDPDDFATGMGTMLLKLIRREPVDTPRMCFTFQWIEDAGVPGAKKPAPPKLAIREPS